jgi:hypothetical protein
LACLVNRAHPAGSDQFEDFQLGKVSRHFLHRWRGGS